MRSWVFPISALYDAQDDAKSWVPASLESMATVFAVVFRALSESLVVMDSGLRPSAGPGITKQELRLPHFENVTGPNQSRRISPKLLPASFNIVLGEGSQALDLT